MSSSERPATTARVFNEGTDAQMKAKWDAIRPERQAAPYETDDQGALRLILQELRVMNLHLMILSDHYFTSQDISDS